MAPVAEEFDKARARPVDPALDRADPRAADVGRFLVGEALGSHEQDGFALLVGAEGFTYEEAARICRTRVGTVKSRVNRARVRLAELLDHTGISGMELRTHAGHTERGCEERPFS